MNEKRVEKVIFISNYFNHHQKSFCEEMYKTFGKDFIFVETGKMSDMRKSLGYETQIPPYVISAPVVQKNLRVVIDAINKVDLVIAGACPDFLIKERIQEDKLTFRYSERLFKKKAGVFKRIFHRIKMRKYPCSKNTYMLCAGAYVAQDYNKLGLFKDKCFKWGYFPETKKYDDIDTLISQKTPNSIIWVGRFIDWKHPETAIEIARMLRDDGYSFQMELIGNGELLGKIKDSIIKYNLGDCVHILGSMKPSEVRAHMEKSQIHIFTSNRQEGWGAVLNEAMNSACVSIASNEIGAAPFLIKNEENGFIYKFGKTKELYQRVKFLLDNKEKTGMYAKKAYEKITNEFNGEIAAKRIISLSNEFLNGEKMPQAFEDGICSLVNKK